MKNIVIVLAKIAIYFCGFVFILVGICGIVICTAARNIFTLVLCIAFLIAFFTIGIFLFYVATKKIHFHKKTKIRNITLENKTTAQNKDVTKAQTYKIQEQNTAESHSHNLSLYKTENNQWNVLFSNIPKYIADLIWIKDKNCNDLTEPSVIDLSLPISSDRIDRYASIGYYPNYKNLSPEQRFCYLDWLQDISQPVDIGYVFIFYYGLERHLFFGDFEAAYKTISILRSLHNNGSFQSYSSDALLISALYHKRYDLIEQADFTKLAPEVIIFLKHGMHIPVKSDDLISIRKHVNFNNDRYLKENLDKFKEIMDDILAERYGTTCFPLDDSDFLSVKEKYPIVLANYSLNNRITFIPDITKNKCFSSAVFEILQETHEIYKFSKQKSSSGKCNCDGYHKINTKSSEYNTEYGTPEYLGMSIVSSTIPQQENYSVLNNMEKQFFNSFYEQLTLANLSPSCVKLTRMSNGGFNVDYLGICYVGKINLYEPPITYAVIKRGNKRATKVFKSLKEANAFASTNPEYEIETRKKEPYIYMQYLRGISTIKDLNNVSLDECIDHIPYWIRYIKYCKRN